MQRIQECRDETHSSPDFLRGNNEVLYHYFETLRVSKYHFLKGLTILSPWQERGVEATFLPQNFLKMFGNNEERSIFFVLLHLHTDVGSCDALQRRRSCRRRITQPEQWCRQPWSSPWWVAPRWVSLDDLSVSRRCTDRSCQTRVAADFVKGWRERPQR